MDTIVAIAREGIIILIVLAVLGGGGFLLLRFRRSIGGGIDDHLRLSDDARLDRIKTWLLAITAALWIIIFVVADAEDRRRLSEAAQGLIGYVSGEVRDLTTEPEPERPTEPKPEIPTR